MLVYEQFWDTFPWQDFFPDISLTVNNIPDMFQIPWHFQVFQTTGHPAYMDHDSAAWWPRVPTEYMQKHK